MTVSIGLGRVGSNFFSLVVGNWVGSGHTKWTHGQLCAKLRHSWPNGFGDIVN